MAAGHQTSFVYMVDGDSSKEENMVKKIVKNEILPSIRKRGYLHLYIDKSHRQDNLPPLPSEEEILKDNIDDLNNSSINRASSLVPDEEEKETAEHKQEREAKKLKEAEDRKAFKLKKREDILNRRKLLEEKDPAKEGWHFYTHEEVQQGKVPGAMPSVSLVIRHSVPTLYSNLEHFQSLLEEANKAVD